jgi:hypothetical protein
MLSNVDTFFSSENCFVEFKLQILAQIRSALSACPSATTTKDFTKSKKLTKDVGKILEDRGVESSRGSSALYSGVTEAVIKRSFFGVDQDRIRFSNFFELLFCLCVSGIPIRMKLHGQLAVRTLDLLLGGSAGYSK